MRVVVVTNYLMPQQLEVWRHAEVAGVELHLVGTLDWFWDTDHFPWRPSRPDWAVVHEFHPVGLRRRGHIWWIYPGLRRLLARLRPDLVHVVSEPYGLLVMQTLCGVAPVVIHTSSSRYEHGGRLERGIRRVLAKQALRRVSGLATPNPRALALAHELGLPDVPTALAQHLVPDPEPFIRARRSSERGELKECVVGYIGRLVPQKGVDWLIEAAAGIQNIRLRIIGQGPELARLQELAIRRGLQAVFAGPIALEDVPTAMAGLDLLVVPSRTTLQWEEFFGRVAVEAMFAGIPVIASNTGGLSHVVSDGGMLVAENDVPSLAAALRQLADSENLRKTLGERGRERALAEFSPRRTAETLVELWKAVA